MTSGISNGIGFLDLRPKPADLRQEVLEGLAAVPKRLSSKFLYDQHGSELFERICAVPDYYLTRTELGILESFADEINHSVGRCGTWFELGSGPSAKLRFLFDRMDAPRSYVSVDISRDYLKESASDLARRYPDLDVLAICADFTQDFWIPPQLAEDRDGTLALFLGSSIGNYEPAQAEVMLRSFGALLQGGTRAPQFLIGVDLVKEPEVLERAYDDREGVTAQFNLNLLLRLNRELGAEFDLQRFRHHATFNRSQSRVEMWIESTEDQEVWTGAERIQFRRGERIHTENSYKYTIPAFKDLASRAGFSSLAHWTDPEERYAVFLVSAPQAMRMNPPDLLAA